MRSSLFFYGRKEENMFLSLGIIFEVGILGGILFEKIYLPKIIFYRILGILMSITVFIIVCEDLMNISSYLRQIALVIILTRSGLSLDIATLKNRYYCNFDVL